MDAAPNDGIHPVSGSLDPMWQPDPQCMHVALRQARKAAEAEEVPVGAAIFHNGRLIAQAHNQVELLKDPTAHAEMIAITQAASALGDWRLEDCVLYVTKEPCPMCAGAIVLARLPIVVWGMTDPQRGGAISRFQILQSDALNHRTAVFTGVMEEECSAVMKDFFRALRKRLADRPKAPPPQELPPA